MASSITATSFKPAFEALSASFHAEAGSGDPRQLETLYQRVMQLQTDVNNLRREAMSLRGHVTTPYLDDLDECLVALASYETHLLERIASIPAVAAIKPAPARVVSSVTLLAQAVEETQRTADRSLGAFSLLSPTIQGQVFGNLWKIRGCPTPESPIPEKRAMAHHDFGKVSFLRTEARCASSDSDRRLALELCMTPSLILTEMIAFLAEGDENKAKALFPLLPPRVQGMIFGKTWEVMGKPTRESTDARLREIAHDKFGEVAFLGQEGRNAPKDKKIQAILAVLDEVSALERRTNAVVAEMQAVFRAIEAAHPGVSLAEIETQKNARVHDLAQELVKILDDKPFVASTKTTLREIVQDYHTRYQGLANSRLLLLFYPLLNETSLINPGLLATLTGGGASAEARSPVVAAAVVPARPAAIGGGGASASAPRPTAASPASAPAPAVHGAGLGVAAAAIHTPLLSSNLAIVKVCPAPYQKALADTVMMDWKITSLLTSPTLLGASLGTYQLDRTLWTIQKSLEELDNQIVALASIPVFNEVTGVLRAKREALAGVCDRALQEQQSLTFVNDAVVINGAPEAFKQSVVNQRIALHTNNLAYIRQVKPSSDLIPRLEDVIRDLTRFKAPLRAATCSPAMQDAYYELSNQNRVCESLLLRAGLCGTLSFLPSYERDSIALRVGLDISEIESAIAAAEALPRAGTADEISIFAAELAKLKTNLAALKRLEDQLLALSIKGTSQNDVAIMGSLASSSIDRAVKALIADERFRLATDNSTYLATAGKPLSYAESQKALAAMIGFRREISR